MDFNDVIFTRRSVRKYLPRAIEKEKLEAVLKAGAYAPTAMNNRNRKFVAVTKPELLSRLNAAVEKSADEATVERIRSRNGGRFDFFYSVPVLIFVVSSDKLYPAADCACANENMFLAAKNEGLGTCWINQLYSAGEKPELREFYREIGINDDEKVYGCCALGYADGETPLSKPKNDEIIIL